MGTAKKARSKTTKEEPEAAAAAAAAPSTPVEKLLGLNLLRQPGAEPEPTQKLLAKKQLVALYFAAADDKACQTLTPRLSEFYTTVTADDPDGGLEIVYVSSDKKLKDFEAFFADMPWLAVGTTDDVHELKTALAKTLAVSEIPFLVVMDVATGMLVADGADCVQRVRESASPETDQALLDEWKAAEPRDVQQAVLGRVRADLTPKNFAKTLVRNVLIMWLLLAVGRVGMIKIKTLIHGPPPPPPKKFKYTMGEMKIVGQEGVSEEQEKIIQEQIQEKLNVLNSQAQEL